MDDNHTPEHLAADAAFKALDHRVTLQTAAMAGLGARLEELVGRDYSEDFAKGLRNDDEMREAIIKLSERPAMTLTPADIACEIEHAGKDVREADHRALQDAVQELRDEAWSMGKANLSARTAEKQKRWLGIVGGVAIIVGFFAGCTIPLVVDDAMPESWHWPEQRAVKILDRSGWDAGVRLMQVYEPAQWNALVLATQLSEVNAEVLNDCAKRAAQRGKAVACSIKVPSTTAR